MGSSPDFFAKGQCACLTINPLPHKMILAKAREKRQQAA
jgi:hypothetical protein